MKLRLTLVLLAVLQLLVVLAAWVAPYDYAEQHRDYPFAPPTRVHFRDAAGRFHLRPFVYGVDAGFADRRLPRRSRAPVSGRFFVGGRLFGVAPPGVLFLWGSDGYGRDVFSRVLYGGRISLLTGLVAAFLSLSLGCCGVRWQASMAAGWIAC